MVNLVRAEGEGGQETLPAGSYILVLMLAEKRPGPWGPAGEHR
jgi:hypothetical protein